MKRKLLTLGLLLIVFPTLLAQVRVYEESQSRIAEPEMKVYVRPLVADLQVLNNQERMTFGPYVYTFENISKLKESDIENYKVTSVFNAAKSMDADIIIGATFSTYIENTEPNTLKIEVIGFPAKYVNFRQAGSEEKVDDYEMIRVAYPSTNKHYEEKMTTKAIN